MTIRQPRDVSTPLYTTRRINGKTKLIWNKGFRAKWTEQYVSAQEYLDSQVLKDCEPFIPRDTGLLIFSGHQSTVVGSGKVKWTVPYARYQYYGRVMDTSPFGGPKILTRRKLKYHGGGLRGSFWFERAKQVHKNRWIRTAAKLASNRR